MKRIVVVFFVLLIICSAFGCSTEENTEPKNNETSAYDKTSTNEIKYADLIPDPKSVFKNGTISIIDPDGGKAYSFRVTGYKDGEFDSYISTCKDMGFINIENESENDGGKMFMAYTNDKEYYIRVFLGNEIEAIDISCKKSR